jgi:uncharacterized metal-binding protein
MPCSCGNDRGINLIYSCSGAANTGFLADQVMRALNRDGLGSSTCLAAVGAELSGFIESARGANSNIILDGCRVSCGKRIFEAKGLPYSQFIMTDFGVEKGKTAITGNVVQDIVDEIAARIKA